MMNRLLKFAFICATSASLTACSMLDFDLGFSDSTTDTSKRLCARDNGDFYECKDMNIENTDVTQAQKPNGPYLFDSNVNFQLLSDYTEQMTMDIKKDVAGVPINKVIAVASFVYFDGDLQSTSSLGNQLAEYFLTDLQEIGLPVADHKVTALLDVNNEGDFSLSRDMDDLNPYIDIGYVFTGTMIPNSHGIVINARLINRESGQVIASSSKLLPNILLNRSI